MFCFDCGLSGHWAGDEACQKPGQGLGRAKSRAAPPKQVRLAEPENEVSKAEASPHAAHDVMMASSFWFCCWALLGPGLPPFY